MKKGLFVTFEGGDGAGKSTQMRFLCEHLKELGFLVLLTREPGGCAVSEKIRAILLDKDNADITPLTEAYLYAAARAQHVDTVIRPAVLGGMIVLCDRFIDSSVAYQGYGRMLTAKKVMEINRHAIGGLMPDVTFLLNVPPKKAFDRMNENKKHDRLESEGIGFHERVFEGFLQIARSQDKRIRVINASGTKFETRDIIRAEMDGILRREGFLS